MLHFGNSVVVLCGLLFAELLIYSLTTRLMKRTQELLRL